MAASTSRSRSSSAGTKPAKKQSPQAKAAATRKRKAEKLKRTRKRIETGKADPAALLLKLPPELKAVSVAEFVGWAAGAQNVAKITRGVVLNPEVELQTLGTHTAERLGTRLARRSPGEQAESLRAA